MAPRSFSRASARSRKVWSREGVSGVGFDFWVDCASLEGVFVDAGAWELAELGVVMGRKSRREEIAEGEVIKDDLALPDVSELVEQMQALQRAAQVAPDLDGVVSREEVQERLDPGGGVSSGDHDQMRALAEGLVLHQMAAHESGEPMSIRKALQTMKVPVSVYAQMARDPEFLRIVKQTSQDLIATPRHIGIMLAVSNKAQMGDVAAVKALAGLREDLDDDTERMYRAYQQEGGRERFMQEVETRIKELQKLQAGFAPAVIPQDVIDQQRKRIHTVVGEKQRFDVDHGSLLKKRREEEE